MEEKIIIGENTKYPMNGLLTLPDGINEPVPAVVFVHGSGASNMDEKVGKLTPFKDLAHGLARHGIASIRYDKRSFAHGFKMLRDKSLEVTVKTETIDDAILATELVKKDSRIAPEKVSPRKLEEIILDQNEEALRSTKGLIHWIVKSRWQSSPQCLMECISFLMRKQRKRKWVAVQRCTISRRWANIPHPTICLPPKSRF